jgi:hypothetical protein
MSVLFDTGSTRLYAIIAVGKGEEEVSEAFEQRGTGSNNERLISGRLDPERLNIGKRRPSRMLYKCGR